MLALAAVLGTLILDGPSRKRFWPAALTFTVMMVVGFGTLVLLTRGEAWRHLFPYTAAAAYSPASFSVLPS